MDTAVGQAQIEVMGLAGVRDHHHQQAVFAGHQTDGS